MFGSEVLEVAIGLILLFLLVSLLASTVREQIEAVLKTRAFHLERGIRMLLDDKSGKGLTEKLYNHPLLFGLFEGDYRAEGLRRLPIRPRATPEAKADGTAPGVVARMSAWVPRVERTALPSYIPSRSFAMALLDLANANTGTGIDLEAVRSTAATMPNQTVARALIVAVTEAKGDVDRARASLEAWFDGTMDRVSGWYKRESQWILLVIGLVLAATMNIDTVRVARELSTNTATRHAIIAQVEATQASLAAIGDDPAKLKALSEGNGKLEERLDGFRNAIGWRIDATVDAELAAEARAIRAGLARQIDRPGAAAGPGLTTAQQAAALDAGVRRELAKRDSRSLRWWKQLGWASLIAIPGWILTALAIGMGAPFWFDLLNKVMVVRSTVKPFEKSPNEGSEDRGGSPSSADRLEPRAGATQVVASTVSAPVAGFASTDAGPRKPTATMRIAIAGFDEIDRDTIRLTVNGNPVPIDDDGMIELPLEIDVPAALRAAATTDGAQIEWTESVTPGLDDEGRPIAIVLR